MLSDIVILNSLEESKGTKKDTTLSLCPFYAYKALYDFGITRKSIIFWSDFCSKPSKNPI